MTAGAGHDLRYQRIIDRLPYGVIVHHELGAIVFANTSAAELVGVAHAEHLIGRPILDLLAPPYLKGLREHLLGLRASDADHRYARERLRRVDGTTIDVEVAAVPFLADGLGEVQLVIHDLRLGVQTTAVQREAELLRVFAHVPGIVWATDRQGHVTLTSQHGQTSELVRDAHVADAQRLALDGTTATCELTQGGRVLVVALAPIRDPAVGVVGAAGLAVDVSDRHRRDERRHADERLGELAQLAGGVAHQLNNVLTAILGHAAALLPGVTDEVRADLEAIVAAGQRGGRVADRLLGFARGGMYRRQPVAVAPLVEAATLRVRAGRATIACTIDAVTPPIAGDPEQLASMLDALLEHALLESPPDGAIGLRAHPVVLAAGDIGSDDVKPGRFVCIEVSDSGPGMTDHASAHAFEPYGAPHGDGLGLAMVHGVARHHGGFVALESRPGAGTRVRVLLPAAAQSTAAAPPPPRPPRVPTPEVCGAVLLVDDDAMVRKAARRVLERMGYAVIEAPDGASALERFAEPRAEPLQFVMLDLRMPRMDGAEVLRHLRALDPTVRVLLVTGYEDDAVTQELVALGRVGFLHKPYLPRDLAAQLALIAQ